MFLRGENDLIGWVCVKNIIPLVSCVCLLLSNLLLHFWHLLSKHTLWISIYYHNNLNKSETQASTHIYSLFKEMCHNDNLSFKYIGCVQQTRIVCTSWVRRLVCWKSKEEIEQETILHVLPVLRLPFKVLVRIWGIDESYSRESHQSYYE